MINEVSKVAIYFDNAATTPVRKEVLDEMIPYFTENYGNPSSIYTIARDTKKAIEKAREQVSVAINAVNPNEIYFTSGGTEANNWAIKGIADAYKTKGNHIITSVIEHHAVLHTCENLEKSGFEVTYLPVNEDGIIHIEDLKDAIRPETILITIMFANNEIGTIQPIKQIGEIAKEHGIIFHTDAVQAVGHIPVDVQEMNIDMLTISGHKVYGSKGIGALYVRKSIKLKSFLHGGAQERNRRGGTENVAGIIGLGKAIELCCEEMEIEAAKTMRLRDMVIEGILKSVPHSRLNGHRTNRLPGNVNMSFEFVEGESILLLLDFKNIYASSGSACTSGSLDPSHVLLAIGLPHEKAHGSLRISLGRYNTEEEIKILLQEIGPIIQRLRDMSPLYEDFLKRR